MAKRDHGGGLDAAIAQYGGDREGWIDLSTGINPVPYPIGDIPPDAWSALPDGAATEELIAAARQFWNVPDGARIVSAPGASALIARLPVTLPGTGTAYIPGPTYNEHAAAIAGSGRWTVGDDPAAAQMHVYVHPNNPDGRLWDASHMGGRALTLIDESFCDVAPQDSHVGLTGTPGIIVLKSFGKFWGLAGLRLGFAIAAPETLPPPGGRKSGTIEDLLGPWPVSGPALHIGARALSDPDWAQATRQRLADDAARLDTLVTRQGGRCVGGTSLFRLYDVGDAAAWQDRLARHHIWSRSFPYDPRWLRLGLPAPRHWDRIREALA